MNHQERDYLDSIVAAKERELRTAWNERDSLARVSAAAEAELVEWKATVNVLMGERTAAEAALAEANVQWHKIRDLHADAVSEVHRLNHENGALEEEARALREPLTEMCRTNHNGHQTPFQVEQMFHALAAAALATPTKEEGT